MQRDAALDKACLVRCREALTPAFHLLACMQLLEFLRSAAPEGIKVRRAAARSPLILHVCSNGRALMGFLLECIALKSLLRGSEASQPCSERCTCRAGPFINAHRNLVRVRPTPCDPRIYEITTRFKFCPAQERAAWYRELLQVPLADVEAALPLVFTGERSKEVRSVLL